MNPLPPAFVAPAIPQPARRSLLKRLSGLVAGSFLAGPLQVLMGRRPVAAAPLTGGGYQPFVGEIILAGFNFAPRGYALCDGSLLLISQNTALFSLLGTTYGGNGQTTFGLPDLRGRVPLHAGQGPGLSPYFLGQLAGTEAETLAPPQLPAHTHFAAAATEELGTQSSPADAYLASNASGLPQYAATGTGTLPSGSTGGSQPHNNLQPFQVIGFYIALQGAFPPRP